MHLEDLNKKLLNREMLIPLGAVVCLAIATFHTLSDVTINITTVYASGKADVLYNKISPGMSEGEVLRIIGVPPGNHVRIKNGYFMYLDLPGHPWSPGPNKKIVAWKFNDGSIYVKFLDSGNGMQVADKRFCKALAVEEDTWENVKERLMPITKC